MNEKTNNPVLRRYKLVAFILPVLSLLAVYIGIKVNSVQIIRDLLVSLTYVLCFDFLFIFYIDNHHEIILKNFFAPIVLILCPAICFYIIHCSNELLIGITVIILVSLLAGTVDINLSLLLLLGICGYTVLFIPSILAESCSYLLVLSLICIFVQSFGELPSLIYSIVILSFFYFIIQTVFSGFVLEKVFVFDNLLVYFFSIAVMTGIYFLRRFLKVNVSAQPDPVSDGVTAVNEASLQKLAELEQLCTRQQETYEEEIKRLKSDNKKLEDNINSLKASDSALEQSLHGYLLSESGLVREDSPYLTRLLHFSTKLYHHSISVAEIAREAAHIINCDTDYSYILGLYHEAPRMLGLEFAGKLSNEYRLPEYIIRSLVKLKDKKNTNPLNREIGIVSLTDDIFNTISYLKSANGVQISMEKIVNNTLKVRNNQNYLRLCGFSNEEIQLLRMYFIELDAKEELFV